MLISIEVFAKKLQLSGPIRDAWSSIARVDNTSEIAIYT
jgi:hypothetical protein